MKRTAVEDSEIAAEITRLRAMTSAELVPKYEELFGSAPRSRHRDWLWKRIAWKIQERRYGGLSATAQRRLDELIAEIRLPDGARTPAARATVDRSAHRRRAEGPEPGSVFTRRWRDRDFRLTILEDGVEVEGVPYGSLSAAAEAITGQHWNGRLFWFGRRRRSEEGQS